VPGLNHAAHLMTHCEAAAAASGATRICLEVATLNERALGFYRKHGFEAVDRASVTDADTDRTLDYTHMAKRL
jgi:ribosomal protein S18 acetylase RimI-like enzyme